MTTGFSFVPLSNIWMGEVWPTWFQVTQEVSEHTTIDLGRLPSFAWSLPQEFGGVSANYMRVAGFFLDAANLHAQMSMEFQLNFENTKSWKDTFIRSSNGHSVHFLTTCYQ